MDGLGFVTFAGAGPGDPGLASAKTIRRLKQADIVIYDRLVNYVLLNYCKDDVELYYVGKNPDHKYIEQVTINELINEMVATGKYVVRLKGGDPGVFGRISDEIKSLKPEYAYEVIPGITSATAAAQYSGFPLTDRTCAPHITFATGHLKKDSVRSIDFETLAKGGTLALYMGMKELPQIVETINQPDLPVAIVGNATYGYQKTIVSTLRNIVNDVNQSNISHPAMILIGDVVRLREERVWFEQLKQFGRKTLYVSSERIDADWLMEQYDNGGYYYAIDGLNNEVRMKQFDFIHRKVLEMHTFDEVIFMNDNAEIQFNNYFREFKR